MSRLAFLWGAPPPAKRAKRLPLGLKCEHCNEPMRSIKGVWLGRTEYAAECPAGCWRCIDCGEMHRKGDTCPQSDPNNQARE